MTIRKLVRKITIPATALEQDSNSDKITIKRNVTIVDRPNIQYIIEETIAWGIEEILIVTSLAKRSIKDHFDKSYELEDTLSKKRKTDILKIMQNKYSSNEVFQPKHFRSRWLMSKSASSITSSLTRAKSVFFGKNSQRRPLAFSLLPLCQGE